MPEYSIDDDLLEHIKSLSVLCVDDSQTTLSIYKIVLEGMVKEIVYAKDGQEGFQKFLDNKIDIIVTDFEMPILDGLQMSEKIRSINESIPILLVSAIQRMEVIIQALNQQITTFIKKPIVPNELLSAIASSTKILIANRVLEEERERKLKVYEEKARYSNYQEELAFSKELNILRNDFYYQMIDMDDYAFIDFFYQPLDTLSGDAYSARSLGDGKTFYFIVDGMGKGISASLSSILITSFLNYLIDNTKFFDLYKIIEDSIEYIKPILLETETLSIDYILLDSKSHLMTYATFAMPALLLENEQGGIERINSNNYPISKYINEFNIDTCDIANINKFLFYSDGIVENATRFDGKLYNEFIEEDFANSYTREDLKTKILSKITEPEDDMTFIFINKPKFEMNIFKERLFQCSLNDVDNAYNWYVAIWEELTDDPVLLQNAGVAFTELYMNAYEHGSLGISASEKHQLLEDDRYFDALNSREVSCNLRIKVSVYKIEHYSHTYVITKITDMGDGFDTKILSEIFRNSKAFNGRGVYISRASSHGIYYNAQGNSVIFLNKI